MPVTEIANGLVELCRKGEYLEAIAKYYSEAIVSVESTGGPAMPAEISGLEAVRQKNQWWVDNHQIHSAEINGPFVGETQFAVEFKYDVTQKASGKRFRMNEMGLYSVTDGKIVREHFFYNPGA